MRSCGANRRELEDQSAIKGKLKSNEIRPSWSLILGEQKREDERRREEEEKKCMETIFVWISME